MKTGFKWGLEKVNGSGFLFRAKTNFCSLFWFVQFDMHCLEQNLLECTHSAVKYTMPVADADAPTDTFVYVIVRPTD